MFLAFYIAYFPTTYKDMSFCKYGLDEAGKILC
jgi:hypothetical protein